MITVRYTDGREPEMSAALRQYDLGQVLLFTGLPKRWETVDVHFSLQKTGGIAKEVHAEVVPGRISARIPDDFLVNRDTDKNYKLYVFICPKTSRCRTTKRFLVIPVYSRPRPSLEADQEETEGETGT